MIVVPGVTIDGIPQVVVTSILVVEDRVIVSGDNLHMVDRISLFGDQKVLSLSGETEIVPTLNTLNIISQDRSRLTITSSLNNPLKVFFGSRYDIVLENFTYDIRVVFPFLVSRYDFLLQTDKLVSFPTFDPKILEATGENGDVLKFSADTQEWELGQISGQFKYLGGYNPANNLGFNRSLYECRL